MSPCRAIITLILFAASLLTFQPQSVTASGLGPLAVTKTADTNDGFCDADCSLREAVITANESPGADVINIPSGTYLLELSQPGGGDDDLAAFGDLDILDSVRLSGSGATAPQLDGNNIFRVLDIYGPADVMIVDITVQHGLFAAIFNNEQATTVIEDSVVRDNEGQGFPGGIQNSGNLTLRRVTVADNNNSASAGAIGVGGDLNPLIIEDSTISGNTAGTDGGGIRGSGGDIRITNTTFSGNSAARNGGAISIDGAGLALENVTITDNTADADMDGDGDGGGVYMLGFNRTFRATVLAGNSDPGAEAPDCVTENGSLLSLGHNLIMSTAGCSIDGLSSTDIVGEHPALLPLAENGGPTLSHLPAPGSPAIDNGDDANCPEADQRGVARPIGPHCDIGSVEAPFTPTDLVWGDHNCSGSPDPIDSLLNLRDDAGLPTETGACPDMGEEVDVTGASVHPWGDVDCNETVDPVDGLKLLRYDAGLSVDQEEGCPEIGQEVGIAP